MWYCQGALLGKWSGGMKVEDHAFTVDVGTMRCETRCKPSTQALEIPGLDADFWQTSSTGTPLAADWDA